MSEGSVTITEVATGTGAGGVSAPGGVNGFQSTNGVGGDLSSTTPAAGEAAGAQASAGEGVHGELREMTPEEKADFDKQIADQEKKKKCPTCNKKKDNKDDDKPAKASPAKGLSDGRKPGDWSSEFGRPLTTDDISGSILELDWKEDLFFGAIAGGLQGLATAGIKSAGWLGAAAIRNIKGVLGGSSAESLLAKEIERENARIARYEAERAARAAEKEAARAAAREEAAAASTFVELLGRTVEDGILVSGLLRSQAAALEKDGWVATIGEAGKGSYANSGSKMIVLDPAIPESSKVGVLAHEMGHAMNPVKDPPIPKPGESWSKWVDDYVDVHILDEGVAQFNVAKANAELGGNGLGFLTSEQKAIYNSFASGQITKEEAFTHMGETIRFMRPSTAPAGTTYDSMWRTSAENYWIWGKSGQWP